MEHIILVTTDLLIFLINLVKVPWCGAGIDTTPSWICLIKCSYYLIDIIYHADLESADFSVVKCHHEIVVNPASVEGHLS